MTTLNKNIVPDDGAAIGLKYGCGSEIMETIVGRLEINYFVVAIDGKPTKYLPYCQEACEHMSDPKWNEV